MIELQQAEITGFLRTILILLFIYYAFKFLTRLFAPYLMKKVAEKIKQKAEQQFGREHEKTTVRNGETVIDKRPQQTKESNKNVGEYVDFEEIE